MNYLDMFGKGTLYFIIRLKRKPKPLQRRTTGARKRRKFKQAIQRRTAMHQKDRSCRSPTKNSPSSPSA